MSFDIAMYAGAVFAAAALICACAVLARAGQIRRAQDEVTVLLREMRQGGTDLAGLLRDEGRLSRDEAGGAARGMRDELAANLTRLQDLIRTTLEQLGATQTERLAAVETQVRRVATDVEQRQEQLRTQIEQRLTEMRTDGAANTKAMREETTTSLRRLAEELRNAVQEMMVVQGQRLEDVKTTVQGRLDLLRQENEAKLEQMRQTVDEKLQGTLEKRLGDSFGLVSKRLEQVHKSVGEMQALAAGVGDLKRVLSNVKTRGTWGEMSLGNLLSQVMTVEQNATNVEIRPGSGERVEFAIRLPGREGDGSEVLLPIDAKFPQEDYERLVLAAENGDKEAEDAALKALEQRIRKAAQDICAKYVCPPFSTDFGVLYLPTEGLYAEVLRRPGLAEHLKRELPRRSGRADHTDGDAQQPADGIPQPGHPAALQRGLESARRGQDGVQQIWRGVG